MVPVAILWAGIFWGCSVEKVASPDVKLASPDSVGDMTVGVKSEKEVTLASGDAEAEGQGDASTGGGVGKIGGDGDSIALWLAIASLALLPLAYPTTRGLRLAWGRWRGKSPTTETRSKKGKEVCLKFSEWES